ncbi:MAG: alpha-glucan family phosphorylase [Methanobacteriota archaeon]
MVAANGRKIAYFSMEVGLKDEIPTYAGGLGILAGDMIRSSADLKIPLVAVVLVSKKGYFRQEITPAGRQIERTDEWEPSKFMELLPTEVNVQIQNRHVKVKAWRYVLEGSTGGSVPILFLDTDVEGNAPEDREITHFLYGGDERYRLKQEIILGMGGVRMLEALGFDVGKYHMNEGHSSLLTLELLHKHGMNSQKVRELCLFTTHTPIEAAHDKFSHDLVNELLGEKNLEILKSFGGRERLNMTLLALNLSNYANGVAKRHGEVARAMFPGYNISSITNGVHSHTCTCESFTRIYDKYLPGWANNPDLLAKVDVIPDEEIWQAHLDAKKALIDHVNKATNLGMNYDTLTIGFARRVTGYKRANLIFSDLNKLKKVNEAGKIQLIFSGKSHIKDNIGKSYIEQICAHSERLRDEIKIAYLENYDMSLASKMVSGADVWLNTPIRPLEASGTSGMKAAHNGVINFSTLDGWWVEGCIEGVTGWAIGSQRYMCWPMESSISEMEEQYNQDLNDLYNKLNYVIVPFFYSERYGWIKMMKNSIGKISPYFNSHRMMREYFIEAYS